MQSDGNLVLHHGSTVVWSSGTSSAGSHALCKATATSSSTAALPTAVGDQHRRQPRRLPGRRRRRDARHPFDDREHVVVRRISPSRSKMAASAAAICIGLLLVIAFPVALPMAPRRRPGRLCRADSRSFSPAVRSVPLAARSQSASVAPAFVSSSDRGRSSNECNSHSPAEAFSTQERHPERNAARDRLRAVGESHRWDTHRWRFQQDHRPAHRLGHSHQQEIDCPRLEAEPSSVRASCRRRELTSCLGHHPPVPEYLVVSPR